MNKLFFLICIIFFGCVEQVPIIDKEAEPASIISILEKEITDQSALIYFKLDKSSTAYLEYGESTNFQFKTFSTAILAKEHNIRLTNLKSDTVYYYRLIIADQNLNQIVSSVRSLRTEKQVIQTPLPVLSMVRVDNIKENSASIYWEISLSSDGQVEYGKTSSYGLVSAKNNTLKRSHQHQLENLQANTVYHFRVRSKDQNGKEVVSNDAVFKTLTPAPVIVIKAPELKSAVISGESYSLVIENPTGTTLPAGGYDTFINGSNKNDSSKHSGLNRVITGLDKTQKQCFSVEAKYTQVTPVQLLKSNEICINGIAPAIVTGAPLLKSATLTGDKYTLTIENKSGAVLPAGGFDTYINGADQNDSGKYTGLIREIAGLDKTKKQCFVVQARYVQVNPSQFFASNEICVNAVVAEPKPSRVAAILESAVLLNKNYVLKWSLPSGTVGLPSGGFDTFINGVDQNDRLGLVYQATKEGLDTTKKQCFMIQTRWLQLDSDHVINSNEICVNGVAGPTPTPTPPTPQGELKAFPEAVGWGKNATGGRGGEVRKVTNLNDSGPGSLRAAWEKAGKATIIFEVAGTINLKSTINTTGDKTLAGQTAFRNGGQGITLKRDGTYGSPAVQGDFNNSIIRYMRFRPGPGKAPECCGDAITVLAGKNIMFDHNTFSWATDETFNAWGVVKYVTMQNSIFDSALHMASHTYTTDPNHPNYKKGHSKSWLAGGSDTNLSQTSSHFTLFNTVFSHTEDRNPALGGSAPEYEMVNTVLYNWGHFGTGIGAFGSKKVNIINHYSIAGSNSSTGRYPIAASPTNDVKIYVNGVYNQKTTMTDWSGIGCTSGCGNYGYMSGPAPTSWQAKTPFDYPLKNYPRKSRDEIKQIIIDNVGANLYLDRVDKSLLDQIKVGKGGIVIDDPSQVGGWPNLQNMNSVPKDSDNDGMEDSWEIAVYGTLSTNNNSDTNKDGYTNLEEYINSLAK